MSICDIDNKILDKIQTMIENDFTRVVLKPLFMNFGYIKVEFYGGSYENGKDLLCWKKDEWGDVQLTVVQAKRYKPTGKAADRNSLAEMVVQICQAAEGEVPYLDGNKYKPKTVYIITPHVINTRVLETAFFVNATVKNYNLKVIDGSQIVKMLRQKLPKVITELIGSGPMINDIMSRSLHNIDLRSALNTYKLKELHDVYCDLDFTVGNITTKLLLSFELKPKNIVINYAKESWEQFKKLSEEIKNEMDVDILVENTTTIEANFNKSILSNNKLIDRKAKLNNKLDEIGINNTIYNIAEIAVCENDEEVQDAGNIIESIISKITNENTSTIKDYIKYKRVLDSEIKKINDLSHVISSTKLVNYLGIYDKQVAKYKALEIEIRQIEADIKTPKYTFTINGNNICIAILSKQEKLKTLIAKITNNVRTAEIISMFIQDCESILTSTEKLLSHEYLSESAGLSSDKKYVSVSKLDRINFSIHEIFNSGRDFVVFGDAGAGKTTTLQFYARSVIEANRKELVLYIPLARSFYKLDVIDATELDYVEYLIQAIVNHLLTQEIVVDDTTIRDMAKNVSSLIIFDGIDEVIDKVPWIINAITLFKEQYPKTQILTSSRLSGKYINKIPFIGLSLLPFDDDQREKFINSWFNDPNKVATISEHLNNTPELNEIVRNPLLATILCVIAEYDIPLPDSEIMLYEERMSLLLGAYDIQKKSVRLKSHPKDLLAVAKKIAYILHRKEARYSTKENIIEKMIDYYQSRISVDKIKLAVEELIDPCNILLPETDDGQFGFGHLRFQEYLVACEIKENRSINIVDYISKSFWRGSFVLLAKMSDNIYYIIDEMVEKNCIALYIETIDAMLKVRPSNEQENLNELISANILVEKFDPYYQ